MKIQIESSELVRPSLDWLVLAVGEGGASRGPKLPDAFGALDKSLGGCLQAALSGGGFSGRAGETLPVFPGTGARRTRRPRRILLVGTGPAARFDSEAARRLAGRIAKQTTRFGAKRIAIALPASLKKREEHVQALAEGLVLGNYRFDAHRQAPKDAPTQLAQVVLIFPGLRALTKLRAAAKRGVIVAESQNTARDLSNEPANTLSPAALARRAQQVAKECGLRCRVYGGPQLVKMRMGGILAVGAGSSRPPRLIVMEHGRAVRSGRGARDTLVLVGKGITFDSGGISIKPSASMDQMKHDMSGAAAVVGAMRAVALLGLPLHVVGVIAAAENLPSGTAYRPGDVIRTHSGKTVEVLNTDAEGRIVLADALHYARHQFDPHAMVDLATLTGACQVALGASASGLFCTHAGLRRELEAAGRGASELVWPLPLLPEHRRAVKSTIADLKNTGGRSAGASTAAGFLAEFAGDTTWAHLDIAGTAWTEKASPLGIKGATGVGVRLLVEWLRARAGDGASR